MATLKEVFWAEFEKEEREAVSRTAHLGKGNEMDMSKNNRLAVGHLKKAGDRLWDAESADTTKGVIRPGVAEVRRALDAIAKFLEIGDEYAGLVAKRSSELTQAMDLIANGLEI